MLWISISKDNNTENLQAFGNGHYLFDFVYRKQYDRWLFWFRGNHNPIVKPGKAFPWTYFKDLCRAVAFLKGEPLWNGNDTYIDSGEEYIREITG